MGESPIGLTEEAVTKWGAGGGGGGGSYCFLCCWKWVHMVASLDEILKYGRHKSYCTVVSCDTVYRSVIVGLPFEPVD